MRNGNGCCGSKERRIRLATLYLTGVFITWDRWHARTCILYRFCHTFHDGQARGFLSLFYEIWISGAESPFFDDGESVAASGVSVRSSSSLPLVALPENIDIFRG